MKFIESIRLENGIIRHLELHQQRADLTVLAFFGSSIRHDLRAALADRELPATGLHKIRITYGAQIYTIEVESYERRPVQSVRLVTADQLDYRYKYADRSKLIALRDELPEHVEPIIVQRGLVTDGGYANVCLFDGESWLTPERPLLKGVARTLALQAGEATEQQIFASDVLGGKYKKLKLINCMSHFSEAPDVSLI